MTPTMQYYSTGESAELVTSIPCPKTNLLSARRAIYELDLGTGPAVGEVFQITGQLEVTQELGNNVSVVTGFILCETSGQADCVGYEVNEQLGENVTAGMHHGERTPSRQWKAPGDMPNHRYLKLICYCASSAAPTGFVVQVMQDYGHLDVVRWTLA